ncbi:SDR family NAD(P)-dependent oxidoreductase [Nocardia salmonicida]|uniref:SDR family NAD(P)-dependent oxidoreductase n=1 Tax=Nocardia salmonicida TaxID=53431 RepID=UPI00366DA12C
MTTMLPLSGKVIWVTGAGRGLGRAIAAGLVDDGATVLATARTTATLDSLAAEHPPGAIVIAPGSVTEATDIDRILRKLHRSADGTVILHGVVNCAGISPSFVRTENLDPATFAEILETNTIGTFRCARAAARIMLRSADGGSIVNVSSVHGKVGYPRIAAYAASKGAVDALTKTLAVEWADRNIRVNTLAPGYFPTDLSHELLESRWGEDILKRIPMKRTGKPNELARAASFLLSDASSYVTGAEIAVDGGWQAW